MKNNQLTFLDMTLFIDQDEKIQTKLYRKSEKIVYNNFKQAIMPKSQKISTLTGEIHRFNHCCSTKNELKNHSKNLKKLF